MHVNIDRIIFYMNGKTYIREYTIYRLEQIVRTVATKNMICEWGKCQMYVD